MTITKIYLENIRGFDQVSLDVTIKPNYANIVVAPNGFGKSSISTAFKGAGGTTLRIPENEKHRRTAKPSVLSIEYNGKTLRADEVCNEISKEFHIHVIKSNLEPKAKLPKINGFTVAKPYLDMPPLDFGPAKVKTKIEYNHKNFRALFSMNGKVVPNIERCLTDELKCELFQNLKILYRLRHRKVERFFEKMVDFVSGEVGTKVQISEAARVKFDGEVQQIAPLKTVLDIVSRHCGDNEWLENILICYQLSELERENRANLKAWLEYASYLRELQTAREFVDCVNIAWVKAEVKEKKERISVVFPEAGLLSNGQRDLIYFASALYRAREISSRKPCVLVIDEVFDYLDDANIVVAQYFISNLIKYYRDQGKSIYVILLTHLDPVYFQGYALKHQKTYLGIGRPNVTNTMRTIISKRDNDVWKEILSKYFLHYNPVNCNISAIFNETFGLPKKHGQSHIFYEFLEEEWNKYITDQDGYDPFAVCAYVRVQIERCAYQKLSSEDFRNAFLECKTTRKKLDFAESAGVNVPEVCFLLGIVYNDAMHQSGDVSEALAIVHKLKNLGLRIMLKRALDW